MVRPPTSVAPPIAGGCPTLEKTAMPKYFVLDTNVLLHNADSIGSFSDNVVVLPMSVIEELDTFKSLNT